MSVKAILVLCAQALLVKSALSQCTSRAAVADISGPYGLAGTYGLAGPYGLAAPTLGAPCGMGAPWAYDGLAYPGLAGRGLGYDGIYGAYDGLAYPGLAGRGLGYDGIYGAYDGLAYPGLAGRGLGYDGIYGSALEFSPTSGGALPVSSASAIAPVGISVVSDNVYEGILAVAGELPFVGTTAIEGVVPSAGAGAINHACGNGINAATAPASYAAPGIGLRGGWAGYAF